jgi:chemotaxis protein methyltransferase WspC
MTGIETLLRQTMGLEPSSIGAATIERAVRTRMALTGDATTEDYRARLGESASEMDELIEQLVVPETWFFRDGSPFVTLARWAVNEWGPMHRGETLRVLTVPCSTGEEPYSAAMALLDAGWPGERFAIDAVDISRRALARAQRAIYGQNSFRGQGLEFRDRYFEPVPGGYALVPEARRQVRFQTGNLLTGNFAPSTTRYDVIFCRNLLIYFDRATQRQAAKILGGLLATDGLLFVGHAETGVFGTEGFVAANYAMSFAFRKAGPAVVPPPRPTKRTSVLPAPARLPPPQPRAWVAETPRAAPLLAANPSLNPASGLEAARRLADQGRLEEAARLCENHLREHGAAAAAWYLLGLARDAAGDRTRARECYAKTLYLEPDHPEALLHLALLAEQSGDAGAAEKFRHRIRRVRQRSANR